MTSTIVKAAADAVVSRFAGEEGATAVEYGVMVGLIVAVIIVIVRAIGVELIPGFQTVNAGL